MTTKVIVTVPEPNDKDVCVYVQVPGYKLDHDEWHDLETVHVEKGKSREFYIHGKRRIAVAEADNGESH